MVDSDPRHFENRLADYPGRSEELLTRDGAVSPEFRDEVRKLGEALLAEWEAELGKDASSGVSGESVYTGIGGPALLYYFLHGKTDKRKYLDACVGIVEQSVPRLRLKYPSFLCGDAGVLAVGVAAHARAGDGGKARQLFKLLVEKFSAVVLDVDSGVPDEVLFGRAGFLYSLLFVQREAGSVVDVDGDLIRAVCGAIVRSGVRARKETGFGDAPLYYEWHGKAYLGAAHGFAGILFLLLTAAAYVTEEDLTTRIRPTVDYLLTLRFVSGNYPSSLGNRADRLVHWCHGAPGFVFLFCKAFQVFGDYRYRDAAYEAAAAVWERGLLRKGFGLCHGVAGNAYALLHIHQTLGDKVFLHRAGQYARFCRERGKVRTDSPDRPLSLFEGLAGTIYFLFDFLDPDGAKFPAFVV